MVETMELIYTLFSLNTRLFVNCLAELTDEMSARRISDRTNSIGFIAVHLVDSRCFLAKSIGLNVSYSFAEKVKDIESVEQLTELPAVREIRTAWIEISAQLSKRLPELTPAELQRPSLLKCPVEDKTLAGEIAFLGQHESYHIGQLAFLRKEPGFPAMSYSAPNLPG